MTTYTLEQLRAHRGRLARAKSLVQHDWKAWGPLMDQNLYGLVQIVFANGTVCTHNFFQERLPHWCNDHDVETVRLMYTNSIAWTDNEIAKLMEANK